MSEQDQGAAAAGQDQGQGAPDTGQGGQGGQAPSASQQLAGQGQGGQDAGTRPVTGQQPGDTGQQPGQQAANTGTWLDDVSDPDVRGWLQSKGFDKARPEDVAKSYRELERLYGADNAGNAIRVPGPDSSEEERMEVFDRLGRPETPDKYELPLPENADQNFANWAKQTFHKAGLTADQAKAVTEAWNELESQVMGNQQAQYQQMVERDQAELKQEWGRDFDRNLAAAQKAARGFGLQSEQIDALEKGLGYKGLMQFMSKIGSAMGEDAFVDGQGVTTTNTVKAKIQELESNQEFMRRYQTGDQAAVEQMRNLYKELANGR